jgi:DNA polymerase-3 subunit delta'
MSAGFLGNAPARALLDRAIVSGRLPHALLLHGPEGVGKGLVATELAAALLCPSREPGRARGCGRCSDCLRSATGNHPDLFRVGRLPKKESRASEEPDPVDEEEPLAGRGAGSDLRPFVLVDQIRSLAEHAAFAPREGRARVFVIDPADRMNAAAQNALLKTLEEPAPRAFLVLVASRPHALLATVRSRCLAVGFSAMPTDALARALEARGVGPDEARSRASLSGGRPGAALTLDVETLAGRRDEVLEMVERLVRSPAGVAELPAMAKALVGEDEDSFLEGLDLVEEILRDAARTAAGAGAPIHVDRASRVASLGTRLGVRRAAELVEGIERVKADLRFHLNRTLAAESVLAAIAGGPPPLS